MAVAAHPVSGEKLGKALGTAAIAWLVAAIFYFYQYVQRSSLAVMIPQLADAFGTTSLGVASIVALFYYGYSPFSLVAGAGMDRFGPRRLMPIAAAAAGVGAILFATGNGTAASVGRLLQGMGGVFAPVGAIYIASKKFPPSQAATLIGATQMFGMAGGAAGQFVVGPLIGNGLAWNRFWLYLGFAGLLMGGLLFVLLPKEDTPEQSGPGLSRRVKRSPPCLRTLNRSTVALLPDSLHSNHDLRHDLGSALPARCAWFRLRRSCRTVGYGAAGLDHRLPVARFYL